MSEARFDLVILHHTSDKTVEGLVQELLVLLDKVGDPYLEYKLSEALLFEQSSSAILDDIGEQRGNHIQEQFRKLKVETELRPTLQLVAKEEPASDEDAEQYICPSCAHSQAKQTHEDVMDTCNKCGLVGEKLKKTQKKEEVYQLEKRKLKQTQTKKMKEAVDRARYEEEETLRKEARERLGLKDKNKTTNILVGVAVISAMGVASYFIADTLSNTGEDEALENTIAVEKTTDKEKKPLITIQAGSGSIVINKAPPQPQGTGGAKGTADQTTSAMAGGSGDSFDTVSMSNQQHAQSNGESGAVTDFHKTPATQAMQQASANNTTVVNSTGKHMQNQAAARQLLANISTTPDELESLKAILDSDKEIPEQYLSKLSTEQFEEHNTRLERLLTLGKPGLALIFAEGIEDPYPASLMVLKIAKYETDRQSIELYDDILLTMKSLAAMGDSVQNTTLLNANLSQAYYITGDKESARALLGESISQLNNDEVSTEQRCQLLVQIETDHRQFGSQDGAKFVSTALKKYAETLPAEEYINANRAYTHLAAAALAEEKPNDANSWLRRVPAIDARQYLLAHLETMTTELPALRQ